MLDPRNEMFMSIKKRNCYKIGGKICPDLATFIEKHCCCRECYGIRPRLQLWNTCSMQCNWRFPRVGGYVADFCWLIIYGRQSGAGAVYFSESFVLSYTVQNLCFPRQLVTSNTIGCRKSKHAVLLVDELLIWPCDWLIHRARAEKQCNWLCRESKHDVLMAEESMLWHLIDW